jgi:IstB-like ATP binding protein
VSLLVMLKHFSLYRHGAKRRAHWWAGYGKDALDHRDWGGWDCSQGQTGALLFHGRFGNELEKEKREGKAGRIALALMRMDLVILDELGYLPFSQAGGALLFHLLAKLGCTYMPRWLS